MGPDEWGFDNGMWTAKTFSTKEIAGMSMAEYAKYRDLLFDAMKEKQSIDGSITIKNPNTSHLTCMWCAAGPYTSIEELETHEEECRG